MMKKLLLLTFLFSTTIGLSQNLVPYKVSEDVSISIPENYKVTDTLTQKITKGTIDNAVLIVMKSIQKDTTTTIESKEDLLTYYKEAQKGFLTGLKGKFLKREFLEIDKKIVLKLNCEKVINGKTQYFENYMFILNNYTYTLMFVSTHPNDTNLESQKAKIIASLKFKPGLTIHNQFNKYDESTFAYMLGKLIGAFVVYGAFVAGLVYLIIRNRKRKRNAYYNNN